jgi:hypothetical protein
VLGEPVVRIVGSALGPLTSVGLVVAAAGAIGWVILSRRRAGRRTSLAVAVDWADACCPACLVLAALPPTGG